MYIHCALQQSILELYEKYSCRQCGYPSQCWSRGIIDPSLHVKSQKSSSDPSAQSWQKEVSMKGEYHSFPLQDGKMPFLLEMRGFHPVLFQ